MTSQSTVVLATLVERVSERAAREQSCSEVPLIVLDEMLNEGWHLERETRLESAKTLLLAAYRSALGAAPAGREDSCVA
ncbi:MAG: hypothetical protein ACI8P0_006779 [Planctomycetaceae bacterium]|jgi:hypothetical protein